MMEKDGFNVELLRHAAPRLFLLDDQDPLFLYILIFLPYEKTRGKVLVKGVRTGVAKFEGFVK